MQPITAQTEYQATFRNRLSLTPAHSRDAIWVGVSAADDQSYVKDQLPSENRPGNESAIVPVRVEGRYYGRPEFNVPKELEPVPVLATPEPRERPIYFELNLTSYLKKTGLQSGDLIRPERVAADAVFAAYYVTGNNIMARVLNKRGDSETDVKVKQLNDQTLNPNDRSAIITALNDARTEALEDRFVVYLADLHPYRDRLFEPATLEPVKFGSFQETLPPKSGRFVYRVRKSDAAGHLSVDGAVAKVIVRVPSLTPGGAPEKLPGHSDDPPGSLRLRVAADLELTHVLTFSQLAQPKYGPAGAAALLRVPNRPDLYPKGDGIRLRAPDGTLLTPQVKKLDEPDVTLDPEGLRNLPLTFAAGPGDRIRIWACTLTRDGIPSLLGGPWSVAMPLAPLPSPTLTVTSTPQKKLTFKWSWPPGSTSYNVALERSKDGTTWERVSGPLPETALEHVYTPASGSWQYRLRVMSPDRRTAHSNIVSPQ